MNCYPKDWKRVKSDWRSHYPKATIEVEVKANIATPNIMRSHPSENENENENEKEEQPGTGE